MAEIFFRICREDIIDYWSGGNPEKLLKVLFRVGKGLTEAEKFRNFV